MAFDYGGWLSILDYDVSLCLKTHVTGVSGVNAMIGGVTPDVTAETRRGNALNHFCSCGAIGIHGREWSLRKPEYATWSCAACFVRERDN